MTKRRTDKADDKAAGKTVTDTDDILLIFHVRKARLKARDAAVCEAEALLNDLAPVRQAGGPLSEQKGVFWLTIPAEALESAESRFSRLGYS
ncbi:MAG TPA: hypothetical protein VHL11_08475, partial [Phototrophicaceae bacterium]|nr:hypothetical protein [Phototrophicaceae bacterium]